MTEKYVDLAEEIWRADEGRTSLGSVNMVLDYLDAHPGHVPGRTIAESTERDLYHAAQHGPYQFRDALIDHRIFVVPDPEPTNADILADYVRQINRTAMSAEECGKWLDAQGVKAPGGDE